MKLKQYQEKNVQKLVDGVLEQLDIDGMRRKIIFQAPTGAGKTVMMTEALCRIHETIAESDCQYSKVAFMWIAPNELHVQSYRSMKNAFTETHRLTPIVYDEMDLGSDGFIHPGEVFFVNWQSINKAKNVIVRGSEQSSSIYEILDRTTREHNIPLVCVIDEEHMFAGENAAKSEKVLKLINPKVEVRISATPKTKSPDAYIKIDRSQVINEGMIKMGISLNPAVKGGQSDEALNMYLLGEAMKKRKALAEAYKKLGVNINPLLLIQMPNDNSDTLSHDEATLKEALQKQLEYFHQSTTDNGKVAVWLSGEKTNLDGIEKPDSMVDVMIFKQAVAMGWDCPRAAVLLIYRKLSSETFTIQTVGRIMRMPQQRLYNDPILNMGYVYTDLSADVIKIEPDDADYISKLHALRREGLEGVKLDAVKEERSNKENNVLKTDFRKLLKKMMAETWTLSYQPSLFDFDAEEGNPEGYTSKVAENRRIAEKHIVLNVTKIQVEIPVDMHIIDEEGETLVENKSGFARTPDEVKQVFDKFCSKMLSGWSKVKCMPVLQGALLDAMQELFEIFETEARMVVCSKQNQRQFADLINRALTFYKNNMMEKLTKADRGVVPFVWEVPEVRDYSEGVYVERPEIKNHALLPYYEQKDCSIPERKFTAYLEENSKNIDWWYKNGDRGSQHFAIEYTNSRDEKSCFYVDFIIRMKDGSLLLLDPKTCDSDVEAPAKNNALEEYMKILRGKGMRVKGGVLIEAGMNWHYPGGIIEHTHNTDGWSTLDLSKI